MAEDGPRRGAKSRAGPRRPEGAAAIAQAMRQRKETMHLEEEDAKADDCQRKPERERGKWADLRAVRRLTPTREHGPMRKTRSSSPSSEPMVKVAGDDSLKLQVLLQLV
ncbi:hypothetical protein BHE74_00044664 [Ensete ventricosum]|nr:hypothetical protein BHE74_00044664 [Ensete ventricosum]